MKIENLFKETLTEISTMEVNQMDWIKLETELKQKNFMYFHFIDSISIMQE